MYNTSEIKEVVLRYARRNNREYCAFMLDLLSIVKGYAPDMTIKEAYEICEEIEKKVALERAAKK